MGSSGCFDVGEFLPKVYLYHCEETCMIMRLSLRRGRFSARIG